MLKEPKTVAVSPFSQSWIIGYSSSGIPIDKKIDFQKQKADP